MTIQDPRAPWIYPDYTD